MTNLSNEALKIRELKERYSLNTIVETGCWNGDGLAYALSIGINRLYSCDINETYVTQCQNKFPFSTIKHQNSCDFFNSSLQDIKGKTLFWLDAHYPTYYGLPSETEQTKFPLLEELQLIKKYKENYEMDVIVCDDLRVLAPENNPYYAGDLPDYFLVEQSIKDLTDVLSDTHDYYTVSAETGCLIFTPKCSDVITNIIINRQAAAGDILLLTPIIKKLYNDRGGRCNIDICLNPAYNNLLSGNPYIRNVVNSFNVFHYDMLINLDLAYEKHPGKHIIDAYANYAIGHSDFDKTIEIYSTDGDRSRVQNFRQHIQSEYVVLHMRKNSKQNDSRNISTKFWDEFIDLILQNTNLTIVQIGAGEDYGLVNVSRIIDLRGQISMAEMKELVNSARVFIGSDSAPAHVAAATTTDISVLFTSVKSEYRKPLRTSGKFIPIAADIECYGCRETLPPPVTGSNCRRGDVECTNRFDAHTTFSAIFG